MLMEAANEGGRRDCIGKEVQQKGNGDSDDLGLLEKKVRHPVIKLGEEKTTNREKRKEKDKWDGPRNDKMKIHR